MIVKRHYPFCAALLLASAAAGCGNGTSAGDGGVPDGSGAIDAAATLAQVTAFCASYHQALAARLHACLGGDAARWAACFDGAPGACALRDGIPLPDLCVGLASSVRLGRVRFDPGQAQGCLDDLQQMACARVVSTAPAPDFASLPGCAMAIVGAGGPNAECAGTRDCDPADYCPLEGGCTAVCQPRIALGTQCAGADCVQGASCVAGGAGPTCVANYDPSTNQSALGGDCMRHDCAPGLACEPMALTCGKLLHAGDACTPGQGLCEPFTWCNGTCVPAGAIGAPCGAQPSGEVAGCLPGGFCDETNACAAPRDPGAHCVVNAACKSGLCGPNGACLAPCP